MCCEDHGLGPWGKNFPQNRELRMLIFGQNCICTPQRLSCTCPVCLRAGARWTCAIQWLGHTCTGLGTAWFLTLVQGPAILSRRWYQDIQIMGEVESTETRPNPVIPKLRTVTLGAMESSHESCKINVKNTPTYTIYRIVALIGSHSHVGQRSCRWTKFWKHYLMLMRKNWLTDKKKLPVFLLHPIF